MSFIFFSKYFPKNKIKILKKKFVFVQKKNPLRFSLKQIINCYKNIFLNYENNVFKNYLFCCNLNFKSSFKSLLFINPF